MHGFALTQMNAYSYPCMRNPIECTPWVYSIFVGGSFSRTKVCDVCHPDERAFNSKKMPF